LSLQAAALLLFNAADKLSYSEISSQLKLPEEDLHKLLHSRSSEKYQILVKKPSSQKISSNDCFEFNSKYTSKNDKIKVCIYFSTIVRFRNFVIPVQSFFPVNNFFFNFVDRSSFYHLFMKGRRLLKMLIKTGKMLWI